MAATGILAFLALLSCALFIWQWAAACRFPLHRRLSCQAPYPAVTILKPLKGVDPETLGCLRSWFQVRYAGELQMLFGVPGPHDPAARIVAQLQAEFPEVCSEMVVCDSEAGANPKVAQLAELACRARHAVLVVSDADVSVPPDLVHQVVEQLREPGTGLVTSLYQLANPATLAMRWEAVAVNADFWSQVLQARSLGPIHFALGAVMAFRRPSLEASGGFSALVNYLADDYQLGLRIARGGQAVRLSSTVVECRCGPLNWVEVWRHQLRWARTLRVCRPISYFFSGLSNATVWPLLWFAASPSRAVWLAVVVLWSVRLFGAFDLQRMLMGRFPPVRFFWFPFVKDLLGVALWLGAFMGQTVEWRGNRLRLRSDGTLVRLGGQTKKA